MKLKSLTGQAITIPLEDGTEWTVEPNGTEVSKEVAIILLEKCPEQLEKVEEMEV